MKSSNFLALTLAVLVLSAFTLASSLEWKIADGYTINFAGTDAEGAHGSSAFEAS